MRILTCFVLFSLCSLFVTRAVGKEPEREVREFIERSKQEHNNFVKYLAREVDDHTKKAKLFKRGRIDRRRAKVGRYEMQTDGNYDPLKRRIIGYWFGDKDTKAKTIKKNADYLKRLTEMHDMYEKKIQYRTARMKYEELKVGKIGIFAKEWHSRKDGDFQESAFHHNTNSIVNVFQITDDQSVLIEHGGKIIKVSGFDTSHLTDDSSFEYATIVRVGTYRYTTAGGGTNTIFHLQPVDFDESVSWLKELVNEKDNDKEKGNKE